MSRYNASRDILYTAPPGPADDATDESETSEATASPSVDADAGVPDAGEPAAADD